MLLKLWWLEGDKKPTRSLPNGERITVFDEVAGIDKPSDHASGCSADRATRPFGHRRVNDTTRVETLMGPRVFVVKNAEDETPDFRGELGRAGATLAKKLENVSDWTAAHVFQAMKDTGMIAKGDGMNENILLEVIGVTENFSDAPAPDSANLKDVISKFFAIVSNQRPEAAGLLVKLANNKIWKNNMMM